MGFKYCVQPVRIHPQYGALILIPGSVGIRIYFRLAPDHAIQYESIGAVMPKAFLTVRCQSEQLIDSLPQSWAGYHSPCSPLITPGTQKR